MKLIVSRYFLYIFIAIEVLLLPKLLPVETYTDIEYYKFILYFMPFLLVGANSGYVYYLYNQNKDYFTSLLFIGSIYFLLISLFIFFYTDSLLMASVSLIMALFMIIEQKVKTEKYFLLAMSIKPLISLVLIFIALLYKYSKFQVASSDILHYAIVIAFVIWISAVIGILKTRMIPNIDIQFKYFIQLIQKGFLINIGTLLLMVVFFTDRYLTKVYYPDYLGSYSFSYNIVQFIVLALTTLAYINVVDIGEKIKNIDIEFIKQKIFLSYRIFLFLFLFFILFVMILIQFYDFKDLLYISLIMGFFMGSFYAINSIGSVAQYKDLLGQLTIIMLMIVIVNILLSYALIFFQVNYLFFIIKTGLLLNLYSVYLLGLVYRKVSL